MFSSENSAAPDAGEESHGNTDSCSDGGLTGVGSLIEEPRNHGQVASLRMVRTTQTREEMGESKAGCLHGRIASFAHSNSNCQEQ